MKPNKASEAVGRTSSRVLAAGDDGFSWAAPSAPQQLPSPSCSYSSSAVLLAETSATVLTRCTPLGISSLTTEGGTTSES